MALVLDFNNITVARDQKPILNNVDWQVYSDQRWVIIGTNGAGKTTLLRVAAAQIHPSTGTAKLLGETLGEVNVFDLRTRIGFASNAMSAHIPNSETVLDAVMTASYGITGRWNEMYEDVDKRRALRVLAEWQLDQLAQRAFGTLSDGEKKRASLRARARWSPTRPRAGPIN
jgi:iron complex transport system ATP-binding protein